MAVNHAFRLISRPVGLPARENFEFVDVPVGEPGPDEVHVRVLYISLDPAMRGWMNDTRSYIPPVGIGEVMRALGLGRVEESRHPDFAVGDHVIGLLGVQERAVVHGAGLTPVDPGVAPLPVHLNALGMTGLTAYFGLLDIGRPEAAQTVVVSGAAGAVGALVGQIAKLKGARAVGIAGGPTKCRYIVEELGFYAAVDYKHEDVAAALRDRCPNGIDVYFDNVGGEILDAALAHLARGARVVICGAISQYNASDGMRGPANYMSLLVNHASMTGFVVFDYAKRYEEGRRAMAGWLANGGITSREDIVDGLESFPETLVKLFTGDHLGKLMIRVAED
ncbi:MAG: NADP-dependent oxidoreductase [Actinomycetota bacterium]|nr:NADP-dependent oxidoreductase [Actinomycetota bacterium]